MANPNWVKGKSANPGGRSKDLFNLREEARKYGPELLKFLVSVARGEVAGSKASDKVKAAELALAYGYGRPMVSMEINDKRPIFLPDGMEATIEGKADLIEAAKPDDTTGAP